MHSIYRACARRTTSLCFVRSFSSVSVNGTSYRLPAAGSTHVAVLIDGGSQEYLAAASAAGVTPFIDALLRRGPGLGAGSPSKGIHALVSGQVPTLTNPNNVAIVCGAPASVTGISGNYFLDETVEPPVERLMNSSAFLRAPTIFAKLQQEAGMKVTILTAKDKLLSLLSHGLSTSPALSTALSIEKLSSSVLPPSLTPDTLREMTQRFYSYFQQHPERLQDLSEEQRQVIQESKVPNIYNPHISLYLLELGLGLFKQSLKSKSPTSPPEMFYLSTTDYVQHKYLPTDPEAIAFYEYIDATLAEFDRLGAIMGFTADHGMNSKVNWDGKPKVVFLGEILKSAGITDARIILPITDPYVKHHSSLGGYATIYLPKDRKSPEEVLRAMLLLRQVSGIYTVLNREEACKAFDLPGDRVGDIVVLGDVSTVLGKTREDHDLDQVPHLRSHGCIDEATVPMVINRRLKHEYERRMTTGKTRNYHLLDMMFNGVKREGEEQEQD